MTRDKKQDPEKASSGDARGRTAELQDRLAPHELLDYPEMAKIDALAVELAKLNEIARLLWLPAELSERDREALIVKAIDQFKSINPTDATESMLATQMIGTSSAAIDCLRRAMLPGQTFEARDMTLKHAQKLMTLYTQQMAALDKHRGKGQQKITVEHLTVHDGGQAVVGNVDAGAAGKPQEAEHRKVAPPQITSAPLPPNPLEGLRDAVPASKANSREPRV